MLGIPIDDGMFWGGCALGVFLLPTAVWLLCSKSRREAQRLSRTAILAALLIGLLLCAFSAFAEEPTTDYSSQSWLEAFGSLHSRISAEYAFTEWKGVDWDALGTACREKIEQAQASDDFNAYYVALRQYGNAIPDGHVRVSNLPQVDDLYVGGGFGFSPALLSDGNVIACWVDETSDAYRAGMRAGDMLIR